MSAPRVTQEALTLARRDLDSEDNEEGPVGEWGEAGGGPWPQGTGCTGLRSRCRRGFNPSVDI